MASSKKLHIKLNIGKDSKPVCRIDPQKDLFKWGPIDAYPLYICFMEPIAISSKKYPPGWPDIMCLYKDEKVWFVCDYENLRNNGLVIFNQIIVNPKKTKRAFQSWMVFAKKVESFRSRVDKISTLPDEDLALFLEEWLDNYFQFWIEGLIPEVANWGGEKLLHQKLMKQYPDQFPILFETLSAPENLSFYKGEELALLRLRSLQGSQLKSSLSRHQKNYSWIKNSYGHAEIVSVQYFEKELMQCYPSETKKKIKEIMDFPKKTKERIQAIIKKYRISSEITKIAKGLRYSIWWQDFRKKYIFMAIETIETFANEISRRKKINKKDLYQYLPEEMLKLIKHNIHTPNISLRRSGFLEYYTEQQGVQRLVGDDANKIIEPFLLQKVDNNIKELKGLVVSSGKVTGKVSIVLSPKNVEKIKKGDILVAPMTSPDFIVAMKKAAAIVTDEGGMTSHAAIVSRELKIPCVVGTKIATKVLKDGMNVEVDATKGIVRILR